MVVFLEQAEHAADVDARRGHWAKAKEAIELLGVLANDGRESVRAEIEPLIDILSSLDVRPIGGDMIQGEIPEGVEGIRKARLLLLRGLLCLERGWRLVKDLERTGEVAESALLRA